MGATARDLEGLAALGAGSAVAGASNRGRVALQGAEGPAFLHRMSTNHVAELPAGAAVLNALVNQKGRFVDLVHQLSLAPGDVLLLCGAGQGPAVAAWLDRFLFAEKIELTDRSAEGALVEVAGRTAGGLVGRLVEGAAALPPWGFARQGTRLAVRSFDWVDGDGSPVPSFLLLDQAAPEADLRAAVEAQGAVPLTAAAREVARIAAGVPQFGHEVAEKLNPLDLDLHDAIHWAKGCYIGQEVIARLDTYGKQARHLAAFVVDDAVRATLAPGAAIHDALTPIGEVTSVAPFTWGSAPTVLGTVKVKDGTVEGVHVAVVREGSPPVDVVARVRRAAQRPHD